MNDTSGQEKPSWPGCLLNEITVTIIGGGAWFVWVGFCFWLTAQITFHFHLQKSWGWLIIFPGGLILAGLGGFIVMIFVTIAAKKEQVQESS